MFYQKNAHIWIKDNPRCIQSIWKSFLLRAFYFIELVDIGLWRKRIYKRKPFQFFQKYFCDTLIKKKTEGNQNHSYPFPRTRKWTFWVKVSSQKTWGLILIT